MFRSSLIPDSNPARAVGAETGKAVTVRSRAPLRLGFSGGGTDLSPFCDTHGGQVLNVTISLYAYTTITLRDDDCVCFKAVDRKQCYEAPAALDVAPQDSALLLHAGVYKRIMRQFNHSEPLPVSVTTYSDVMPGSVWAPRPPWLSA